MLRYIRHSLALSFCHPTLSVQLIHIEIAFRSKAVAEHGSAMKKVRNCGATIERDRERVRLKPKKVYLLTRWGSEWGYSIEVSKIVSTFRFIHSFMRGPHIIKIRLPSTYCTHRHTTWDITQLLPTVWNTKLGTRDQCASNTSHVFNINLIRVARSDEILKVNKWNVDGARHNEFTIQYSYRIPTFSSSFFFLGRICTRTHNLHVPAICIPIRNYCSLVSMRFVVVPPQHIFIFCRERATKKSTRNACWKRRLHIGPCEMRQSRAELPSYEALVIGRTNRH